MSPPVIELEQIHQAYGRLPVLRDVHLTLQPGEILGLLGVSGSGKSTLLRIIAGFVSPNQGRVKIGGQLAFGNGKASIPIERRGLGMMFQDYALFPSMSVRDNVGYGIHRSANREERVQSLLELVQLNHLSDRKPGTLSGGQQQRVALVRALAPEPAALLLDEPFANLDGPMRQEVGSEIRRILKQRGTGAILVTHDRREALSLSDRVAVLGQKDGESGATVVQLDRPEVLYNHPHTREVAELTGPVCFVEAMAQGEFAESALGRIPLQQPQLGQITAVIRPDAMQFRPAESGTFTIQDRQFLGPEFQVYASGEAGLFWAKASGEATLPGTRGHIEVVAPCATLTH